MKQSMKRIAIVVSIFLNLGFLSAAGWMWVKESTKKEGDILSQHYGFYHRLDLSVEQDHKVDSLLEAYLERQATLRSRLTGLERQLKDCALSANGDSTSLAEVTSQIGGLRKEQEMLTAQHLRSVRIVLTAAQLKRMNAILDESFSQRNK